jgi:hypothetical protein
MQLSIPDPESIRDLAITFRKRASLAKEIGSQLNSSFVNSGWSSPEQARFASQMTVIVEDFSAIEQLLNLCSADASRLAIDYADFLAWLVQVETQIRQWIENEANSIISGVEHIVGGLFSTCENLLGVSYESLPPTCSPGWKPLYERAVSQGFVLQ